MLLSTFLFSKSMETLHLFSTMYECYHYLIKHVKSVVCVQFISTITLVRRKELSHLSKYSRKNKTENIFIYL